MPLLAVDAIAWWLFAIAALSVIALVLIVIAPGRRVRREPPLDEDVQTRLLLNEDPEEIAEDVEQAPDQAPVAELHRDE
jgi:hypothetical protein